MSEAVNNIKQYEPGFRLGFPLTLDRIDTTGANAGNSIIYDGSNVLWQPIGSLSAVVEISSNELKNMHASPITLVPAPGVGKYIAAASVVMKYTFGGIAYTQPGNTNVVSGITTNNIVNMGNVLNSGSSFVRFSGANNSSVLYENAPLQLFNTTGELTNGNGTATVYVYYSINTF